MKIRKLAKYHPVALAALGVFFGRGAQADTILDFDSVPPDQLVNSPPGVLQSFGDNAAASSEGVTVTGFGTPNIGLSWGVIGGDGDTRWDYYNDGSFWMLGQTQGPDTGATHTLTFSPNNVSVGVVIKSFNFFPYYTFDIWGERFTYDISVLDGATVVSGPIHTSFQSDGTKNHPVNINYTGTAGHTLELRIAKVTSQLAPGEIEGGGYDIGVDDITFAQLPATTFPAGPEVVSVTPANNQTGVPGVYYPYLATITNGSGGLVAGSIQLRLDGTLVSPAPTISSAANLTNVSFLGTNLLTSGSHIYKLTYSDSGGSSYANQVQFTVSYVTLPVAYALPSGAGVTNGFTCRTVSASTEVAASTLNTNLASTVARAKAQLAHTLINPDTGLPYTNSATVGPNADGSFNIDTVLNFSDTSTPVHGNFPDDALFPGLDSGDPANWFSTEALLYLNLPAGYYRFGVNSDDGFEVSVVPRQGASGSPIVLGLWDAGRGAADTLFDVLAPTSGVYPIKVIYFENDGYASCEFFSVTNLVTGDKVLVNDPADANAIKSYLVLKPLVTSIVKNGSNVDIQWAYGVPPFQVQTKADLNSLTWNNSGGPTSSRTASVPITGGATFIRVVGH